MTEVGRTRPTASGIEAAEVITHLAFCRRFAHGKQDFVPAHMRYNLAAEAVQGGYMPGNCIDQLVEGRMNYTVISDDAMKTALPTGGQNVGLSRRKWTCCLSVLTMPTRRATPWPLSDRGCRSLQ